MSPRCPSFLRTPAMMVGAIRTPAMESSDGRPRSFSKFREGWLKRLFLSQVRHHGLEHDRAGLRLPALTLEPARRAPLPACLEPGLLQAQALRVNLQWEI
jgi:hypothetical protein